MPKVLGPFYMLRFYTKTVFVVFLLLFSLLSSVFSSNLIVCLSPHFFSVNCCHPMGRQSLLSFKGIFIGRKCNPKFCVSVFEPQRMMIDQYNTTSFTLACQVKWPYIVSSNHTKKCCQKALLRFLEFFQPNKF